MEKTNKQRQFFPLFRQWIDRITLEYAEETAYEHDWKDDLYLSGRMDNKEVPKFDKAAATFLDGLQNACMGNLEAGASQIAAAYLLDHSSISFHPILPKDEEARRVVLDALLTWKLMKSDEDSITTKVLIIMVAEKAEHKCQGMIRDAMVAIDMLLTCINRHADDRGPLDGWLTPKKLYHCRSRLYQNLGNKKKAIKDLSLALKIDPSFTSARFERARLYGNYGLADGAVVQAEFKQVVGELHADDFCNDAAYAWLAINTLEDFTLGTFEEAKQYYEKSMRATARKRELYGDNICCSASCDPDCLFRVLRSKFLDFHRSVSPFDDGMRRKVDFLFLQDPNARNVYQRVNTALFAPDQDRKHFCISCKKTARDVGKKQLSKCSRCKEVSYCSKKCQIKDWKSGGHKDFCCKRM